MIKITEFIKTFDSNYPGPCPACAELLIKDLHSHAYVFEHTNCPFEFKMLLFAPGQIEIFFYTDLHQVLIRYMGLIQKNSTIITPKHIGPESYDEFSLRMDRQIRIPQIIDFQFDLTALQNKIKLLIALQ